MTGYCHVARDCCLWHDDKGQPRGQGCHLQQPPLAGATASRDSARAANPQGAARRQQRLSQGRLPTPTAATQMGPR
ncbi:hypothetical protein BHM03_00029367 [Ensete ventricosum]|nr:hypothetical protein BHM03_00029367 [Ensete ventricosum]